MSTFIEAIVNGTLPKQGIIRRTGRAIDISVTTMIDGDVSVVQDVEVESGIDKEDEPI